MCTTVTKTGPTLGALLRDIETRHAAELTAVQAEGRWSVTHNDPRRYYIAASGFLNFQTFCEHNGLNHAQCVYLDRADIIDRLDPARARLLFCSTFRHVAQELQRDILEAAEARGLL